MQCLIANYLLFVRLHCGALHLQIDSILIFYKYFGALHLKEVPQRGEILKGFEIFNKGQLIMIFLPETSPFFEVNIKRYTPAANPACPTFTLFD